VIAHVAIPTVRIGRLLVSCVPATPVNMHGQQGAPKALQLASVAWLWGLVPLVSPAGAVPATARRPPG